MTSGCVQMKDGDGLLPPRVLLQRRDFSDRLVALVTVYVPDSYISVLHCVICLCLLL